MLGVLTVVELSILVMQLHRLLTIHTVLGYYGNLSILSNAPDVNLNWLIVQSKLLKALRPCLGGIGLTHHADNQSDSGVQ